MSIVSAAAHDSIKKPAVGSTHNVWVRYGRVAERAGVQSNHRLRTVCLWFWFESDFVKDPCHGPLGSIRRRIDVESIHLAPSLAGIVSSCRRRIVVVRESVGEDAIELPLRIGLLHRTNSSKRYPWTASLPSTKHFTTNESGTLELVKVKSRCRNMHIEPLRYRRGVERVRRILKHPQNLSTNWRGESRVSRFATSMLHHRFRIPACARAGHAHSFTIDD